MLTIRTILHPTDFSQHSEFAFRVACSLAQDYRAKLVLVHVVSPVAAGYGEGVVVPIVDVDKDELWRKLSELKPSQTAVVVDRRLADGDAPTEILRLANETHADVIVMGTHGRTGLGRLLMGSVAELVVRRATCPVLTVKMPLGQSSETAAAKQGLAAAPAGNA